MRRDRQRVDGGINITVYRNKEGRIYGYTVSGHYGQRGSSIVCAGVSALAQTTLKGLGEHFMRLHNLSEKDLDRLSAYINYRVAPGDLQVRLTTDLDDITDALLETMLIGLYDIHDEESRENDLPPVHILEIQQDQEV